MEVDITEFEEISPDEVHLVKRGANGFPALIAKAAAEEIAEVAKLGVAEMLPDGTVIHDCSSCHGSGIDVEDETKVCPECNGKGLDEPVTPVPGPITIDIPSNAAPLNAEKAEKCKTCDGTGKIMDGHRDCPDCDGPADAEKAVVSTADQNDLPDSDFAYIEPGGEKDSGGKTIPRDKRHFPIMDAAHVRNALAQASKSPFGDKAMPAIKAAAKKFGIDAAEKADLSEPDPLDTPDVDTMQTPGSAGWEAQDAANLIAAGQALAQALQIVNVAQEREQTEVATGHAEDVADVMDLGDALYAIQAALGIVARVAFQEEAESVSAGATKAGKVLSAKNVTGVKAAIQALQDLLTSAGETDNDGEDAEKSRKDISDMTPDELAELVTKTVSAVLDERDAAKLAADETETIEPVEGEEETAAKAGSEEPAAVEVDDSAKKAEEDVVETLTKALEEMKERLTTVEKMAAPGGPAKTRTPNAVIKSEKRDALDIEIATLERKADESRSDLDARKGYLDRAKDLRDERDAA